MSTCRHLPHAIHELGRGADGAEGRGAQDADVGERELGFMRLAIAEGERALAEGEVPVGCVLVLPGAGGEPDVVVGAGGNKTNEKLNATRHAELEAIDNVLLRSSGRYDCATLRHCELYVTCEPCIMCAGALAEARVRRVFFGCRNERFGGCGSVLSLHEGPERGAPHAFECVGGVMAGAGVDLLKRFYSRGNAKAPKPQRKCKPKRPARG
eukprot:g5659.t1